MTGTRAYFGLPCQHCLAMETDRNASFPDRATGQRPRSPDGLPPTIVINGFLPGRQGFPCGRPTAGLDRPLGPRLPRGPHFGALVARNLNHHLRYQKLPTGAGGTIDRMRSFRDDSSSCGIRLATTALNASRAAAICERSPISSQPIRMLAMVPTIGGFGGSTKVLLLDRFGKQLTQRCESPARSYCLSPLVLDPLGAAHALCERDAQLPSSSDPPGLEHLIWARSSNIAALSDGGPVGFSEPSDSTSDLVFQGVQQLLSKPSDSVMCGRNLANRKANNSIPKRRIES